MSQGGYRVSLVQFPENWEPASLDDSPDGLRCIDDLSSYDLLEDALEQVLDFNRESIEGDRSKWAVIFETPVRGRLNFRVCTPLSYRIVHIHWPDGWTPESPFDVPDCQWHDQSDSNTEFAFDEGIEALRSLNEAHLMEPNSGRWSIMVAVECEPVHTSLYCDHLGTETSMTVRRLHMIKPIDDAGHRLFDSMPAISYRPRG